MPSPMPSRRRDSVSGPASPQKPSKTRARRIVAARPRLRRARASASRARSAGSSGTGVKPLVFLPALYCLVFLNAWTGGAIGLAGFSGVTCGLKIRLTLMMMKRFLSALLATAALTLSLSACNDASPNANSTSTSDDVATATLPDMPAAVDTTGGKKSPRPRCQQHQPRAERPECDGRHQENAAAALNRRF